MYKDFRNCQQKLANIQAIEYFFALEVIRFLENTKDLNINNYTNEEKNNLFHLLIKLMYSYTSGNSCIKIKDIANNTFFNSKEENKQGFKFLNYENLIKILEPFNNENLPIYFSKKFDSLYIKRLWLFENEIANFIEFKLNQKFQQDNETIKNIVNKLFSEESDQKKAVIKSLNSKFSIISGGPGTGKTTTVAKLLLALQILNNEKPLNVALLAPTGKASQRVTESILNSKEEFLKSNEMNFIDKDYFNILDTQGETIHRFLGIKPNSQHTKYNSNIKAPYDVIIVDESSMLDINIFIKLIRAIKEDSYLILLGDINQLPSVEAGNLLHSFTDDLNGQIEIISKYTSKLEKNYRSNSDINSFANDILNEKIDFNKDNSTINYKDLDNLDNYLKEIVEQKYKHLLLCKTPQEALQKLKNFKILVGNKNINIGTNRLNNKIEKLLGKNINSNYKGKPIMITENSYSLGLFNGDIGIIWDNNEVYFENKEESININMLSNYETVYAMTIHKTQGSEFNEIALIIPEDENNILTKQLIYTGVTRAKNKIDIIAKDEIFQKVIKKSIVRNSNINQIIKNI